jgi:hypothetical protein
MNFAPHDGWGWDDGPRTFAIPKADLIEIGANAAIWGQ